MIGQRIGVWKATAFIAEGGGGAVYRAERDDGRFEQSVALKLLHHSDSAIPSTNREHAVVASLDHPHIARLIDAGIAPDGRAYLVMELVEGMPLDRHCETHGLGVPARLKLFRTVCAAVGYAHAKGVLHRDLKMSNILVDTAGTVKLIDFGLSTVAERLDDSQDPGGMTLTCASPEQIRGEMLTPASDVYALGVALYRLLTGTSPYGDAPRDRHSLAQAVCELQPVAPSRVAPANARRAWASNAADLDAVALKSLRKEPLARYGDATALSEDIFRIIEGLPVLARRGALAYRTHRFILRNRYAFGAAMLANLLLAAALGVVIAQQQQLAAERTLAEHNVAGLRELAQNMVVDIGVAVMQIPGATDAVRAALETAIGSLEDAASDPDADATLLLRTAQGYADLAANTIQGRRSSPDTFRVLDRADALLDRVAAQSPLAPAVSLDLANERARVKFRRGQALLEKGDTADGERVLQELLALPAPDSADPKVLNNAAFFRQGALFHLAGLYVNTGRLDDFRAIGDALLDIATKNVAARPDDPSMRGNLAAAYAMWGTYYRLHEPGREGLLHAIDAHRQGLAVMLSPRQAPISRSAEVNAGFAGYVLSSLELEAGQAEASLNSARDSADRFARLLAADFDNPDYLGGLASSEAAACAAELSLERVEAAIATCRKSLAHYARSPRSEERTSETWRTPVHAHFALGRALLSKAESAQPPDAAARKEGCANLEASREIIDVLEARFGVDEAIPASTVHEALAGCHG